MEKFNFTRIFYDLLSHWFFYLHMHETIVTCLFNCTNKVYAILIYYKIKISKYLKN